MRIDSFMLGCGLLLCSLLALFLGEMAWVVDVAYVGILVAFAVMALDNWLDWLLIRWSAPRPASRRAAKKLKRKTA